MADIIKAAPEHESVTSRSEAAEWQVRDILFILYKRRWIAIATFVLAMCGVAAYTMTMTPIYEAQAQLLLADKPSIVTFEGDNRPNDERGYLETQQRLLRSRSLARRVIEQLNLWDAGLAGQSPQPAGTAGSPAVAVAPKETAAESASIDRLLSHLTVIPVRDTRIIEVKYESTDPKLAALVVNTLTSTYIAQNLEVRSHTSKEASVWLANQLAEQRHKVEMSEMALQKYRERENSLSLDSGQNIVVQRLNALNASVTQAKTDLIAAESMYRQLEEHQNNREALDTFPPIRANEVVQEIRGRLSNLQREKMQLSSSLGAKHPDMVRLDEAIAIAQKELQAEVAKTVESVRQDYLAAMTREKELTAALEQQKASALALNRQGIEYGVLMREVESNRQIYQSLLQRANETAVSNELKGSNIEVVDPAEVPRFPIRPNTRYTVLLGLLFSAILGIGMAYVLEGFDTRIQTASAARSLGLPFLGMLPFVSKRSLKGHSLLLSDRVPAAYAEAFRAIRTNVLASSSTSGGRSLLVTSASPGDGKSVVAVNLALALGRSGRRVLLIDADLRRPVVHELLDCKQRPGLSEVLRGTRKPSDAVVATYCPGVWLLPSGASVTSPSEQLGSRRFSEFLEKLGESFDWIIIDSPPVMAVTDPAVIAKLASGVLFVVNAKQTRMRVAQAALDRIETAGGSFAGVVVNAITLDRDQYYNAYYNPYYGEHITGKRSA
jgi:capsular exopolysaccharide synthesis family protein